MAESIPTAGYSGDSSDGGDGKDLTVNRVQNQSQLADGQDDVDGLELTRLECAVCLQGCVHPVQLPCGHIFCFLCVKGVANQSKRCAMCRKELPADYLERPNLVGGAGFLEETSMAFDDGNQWFYEGHNGWWQYDERTSAELEAAFKSGFGMCELLIAGFLYVIDFHTMVQFRRNDPSRRRHIKRDLVSIPKKGIAGLRVTPNPEAALQSSNEEQGDAAVGGEIASDQMTASISAAEALSELLLPSTTTKTATIARPKSPSSSLIAPNNTPQTPHTPSQDSGTSSPTATCDPSLHHIVQDMEHLLLLDSVDDEDEEEEGLPDYPTFNED